MSPITWLRSRLQQQLNINLLPLVMKRCYTDLPQLEVPSLVNVH
jgi:hypothetical protein